MTSHIILLRYEELLDDLEGQMRYVADRLGIAIAETVWPEVQAATFQDMKVRASELAAEASHDGFYNDRDQFFLGDEELPRYAVRVAECAPADLAAWIHRPSLPAADDS